MRLRVQVTKEGGVRFISHLEYSRALNRAVRRAKLPVAYSEGFNPHIKMSLASALSVGVASLAEYAEFELAESVCPATAQTLLNKNLPVGIRVLAADVVDSKQAKLMAMLTGAQYQVQAVCSQEQFQQCTQAIADYNQAESALLLKKMPPGKPAKQVDVKKFVEEIGLEFAAGKGQLGFFCHISASGTVKAQDVVAVLLEHFALPDCFAAGEITRTALYQTDKKPLICQ